MVCFSAAVSGAPLGISVPAQGGLVRTTLASSRLGAVAIIAEVIAAVSWVGLTKVVAAAAPLKVTFEPEMKLTPSTVRVNAAEPATVPQGVSAESTGTGLPEST